MLWICAAKLEHFWIERIIVVSHSSLSVRVNPKLCLSPIQSSSNSNVSAKKQERDILKVLKNYKINSLISLRKT